MTSLRQSIVGQFKRPHGVLGRLAGWILANRGSNLRRNAWTVGMLALEPKARVLEIGCGPGVALRDCLARGAGISAVGVDHSDVMIAQARARNRRAVREGRLRLICGRLEDVTGEARFDRIFSINLVQFVDDPAGYVGQCRERLVPGGLLATTFQPRNANPTRAGALEMGMRLVSIYRDAGFADVRQEILELKPVPAICVIGRKRD